MQLKLIFFLNLTEKVFFSIKLIKEMENYSVLHSLV